MTLRAVVVWFHLGVLAAGCAASPTVAPDDGLPDAPRDDATDVTPDVVVPTDAGSPAARCASSFGSALPSGYGRLDGTVLALVAPTDTQCAMPNGTHVVLQVTMGGAAYRVVVNVASTVAGTDPAVRFAQVPHALPAPAFAEGFHAGVALDYATALGLHAGAPTFQPVAMDDLVRQVLSRVRVGAPVAVYSQGSGGSSTHIVHRNGNNDDGAIVLDPAGPSPQFLVFHFADQSF